MEKEREYLSVDLYSLSQVKIMKIYVKMLQYISTILQTANVHFRTFRQIFKGNGSVNYSKKATQI